MMKAFALVWAVWCCPTFAARPAHAVDLPIVFDWVGGSGSRLPKGWEPRVYRDAAEFQVIPRSADDRTPVLRLKASGGSFFVSNSTKPFDPVGARHLHWAWKPIRAPKGGITVRGASEQALQVVVVFDQTILLRQATLAYLFDPTGQAGTWYDDSTFAAKVHALVVDADPKGIGEWKSFHRDIVKDYSDQFGEPVPKVLGVLVQCNANHVADSIAEGVVGPIRFTTQATP